MVWRDVLVPSTMVESDGFTTEVGATLTVALELFCRERRPAGGEELAHPVGFRSGGYDLVGEVRDVSPHGAWTFAVGGLTFYVTEGADGPPSAGSWLRVRGELSVAEWHVVHEFGHSDALRRASERSFVVERIVRLQSGRAWEVETVGRVRPWGSHYALTLAES